MKKLQLEPLTAGAFFAYGDVIEMDQHSAMPMNNGMAERYHALARVETYGDKARAVISLVQSKKYDLPHVLKVVERHPLGSQSFIPLDATPFIVIVAPAGDVIDSGQIRAFKTNGQQGINYHAGVWHGLLFTPFDEMNFICVDRDGPGNNCEERYFDEKDQLMLEGLN